MTQAPADARSVQNPRLELETQVLEEPLGDVAVARHDHSQPIDAPLAETEVDEAHELGDIARHPRAAVHPVDADPDRDPPPGCIIERWMRPRKPDPLALAHDLEDDALRVLRLSQFRRLEPPVPCEPMVFQPLVEVEEADLCLS